MFISTFLNGIIYEYVFMYRIWGPELFIGELYHYTCMHYGRVVHMHYCIDVIRQLLQSNLSWTDICDTISDTLQYRGIRQHLSSNMTAWGSILVLLCLSAVAVSFTGPHNSDGNTEINVQFDPGNSLMTTICSHLLEPPSSAWYMIAGLGLQLCPLAPSNRMVHIMIVLAKPI